MLYATDSDMCRLVEDDPPKVDLPPPAPEATPVSSSGEAIRSEAQQTSPADPRPEPHENMPSSTGETLPACYNHVSAMCSFLIVF